MKNLNKKIFSKNITVEFETANPQIEKAVAEQLSYYPSFEENEKSDILIKITDKQRNRKILYRNPSVHEELENGFIAHYNNYSVAYSKFDGKTQLELFIRPSGKGLISFLKKFNNIEFATREERAAQILFESALVPATFFETNLFPVHSSGFEKNGKGILTGGTGGSGKTSLELELCLRQNFTFLNDDIAIINSNGEILPNLAHPKIYGYNLINNDELKNKLFSERSALDKFHWAIKSQLYGIDKARRRFEIRNFNYSINPVKLSHYFILAKENRENIIAEEIYPEKAAQMHLSVILAEYYEFLNHVKWHEFNARAFSFKPIIEFSSLSNNWLETAKKVFGKVKTFIIKIPFDIEHRRFLKEASEIISREAGV